ncbi:hypothetical protein [Microbacterium sp. zg.Y909]|uniref:hypothetical protein n=1 Tax=Microbacterium sp. zg.Y909 TaxID=2969413 RepID=UPI00214B39D2|nr:hypothetical protein [Microbacterium sp. zg.Y909]MCR2824069.1 hypothetical protein [Microbacterium sp. zg.Y909]
MRVIVDADVRIEDPGNLTELAVVSDLPAEEIATALRAADLGDTAGDHAWLRCAALEEQGALLVDDPQWRQRFQGMLDYARRKGWMDDRGEAVRAHITARE